MMVYLPNWKIAGEALDIHRKSFADVDLAPDKMFLHKIHDNLFVGEVEDRLRGYAVIEKRQPFWFLWEIAVAPGCRKTGVGGRLLDDIERVAREKGEHGIELTVRADNDAALALYERKGYQAVRRLKRYYLGGVDGLYLRRDI